MADKPRDPDTGKFISPAPAEAPATTPAPTPTPDAPPTAAAPAKSPYDLGDTKLGALDFLDVPAAKVETPTAMPAATPAAATPVPPPVPTDKRRLRLAQDLGLTEAQTAAMSPQDLDDEIYVRTRTLAASRSPSPEPPRPAPAPAAPPEEPPALDFGEFEKELNPAFSKALKDSLGKHLTAQAKELAALKQKLGDRDQRDQQSRQEQWYKKFDEQFAKHPAAFGASRTAAQADPALMQRRLLIVNTLAQHPEADWERVFNDSLGLIVGVLPAQPTAPAAPAAPAVTPEGYARPTDADYADGLARPTDRSRLEPKGRVKAERVAGEWMKANGFLDDDEPDMSGFLPNRRAA